MANYTDFQIFRGDVHITTISTKTKAEAAAYFCGLCAGYRDNGAKGLFNLLDADGNLIKNKTIF